MLAYTCTHCRSTNEYGVVNPGPAVTLTCVACGAQFVPSMHVTEEKPRREHMPRAIGLPDLDVMCARDRLEHHVRKYPDYLDRDRDILLLRIFEIVARIPLER